MAAFAEAPCLLGELVALRRVAPGLDGVEDRHRQPEPVCRGGGCPVKRGERGEALGVAVERVAARVELARKLVEEVVGDVGRSQGVVRAG